MNISINYSDTKFAIINKGERYTWAVYLLFVFLSSLFGDTLILIASFNKKAFKINIFLVTIIQHIAAVDLSVTMFDVLPTLISVLANSWILGDNFCFIRSYIAHYIYPTGIYMITLLTTSKFLLLTYPLRAPNFTKKKGHQLCFLTWTFCLIVPALMIAFEADDVKFDFRSYNCGYQFNSEIWEKLLPILAVIFSFGPNVLIIATTIPTLKYLAAARKSARRVQGSIPWKGALTVALTAFVYIISNLPYAGNIVAEQFMKSADPLALKWLYIDLFRFTTSLLYVNTMSNFYIYFLTMKSFRKYLFSKSSSVVPVAVSLETIRSAQAST